LTSKRGGKKTIARSSGVVKPRSALGLRGGKFKKKVLHRFVGEKKLDERSKRYRPNVNRTLWGGVQKGTGEKKKTAQKTGNPKKMGGRRTMGTSGGGWSLGLGVQTKISVKSPVGEKGGCSSDI